MKKLFLVAFVSTLFFSCNSEKKESDTADATLIRGEFILSDGAAVIKGEDFIYGVEITELTNELAKRVAPLQREQYDMVPVVVRGVIKKNEEDGWEEIVELKEIIGVTNPTSKLPTKIKSSAPMTEEEQENLK
ncbi:hypothetical protein [Aquimarina brevivitae]|uniref:NlpE-like protein n=1 Tax=Aquimarina brevivitae TaxID=323412 RepID=A0A4Q7PGV4_9FLAO|nr:hypothetical protein [Aquimarina brevivitae]RZS99367.1 hypothetical protein EV197_0577 [Aquimarina brevivitae]